MLGSRGLVHQLCGRIDSILHLVDCTVTLALPDKGRLPSRGDSGGSCIHSINHFHPLAISIFVELDGEGRVEGSNVKRTRIESGRGDSMAAHVYDCSSS